MSGRRMFRYLALVSAVAGLGCGNYTALTSPTSNKTVNTNSPVGAAFSRYILISGAQVCVEGCSVEAKSTLDQKIVLSVTDTLK